MNEPKNRDEHLAAFFDGRLAGSERAKMMEHLTAEADAYAVFAGTVAILREAKWEDAGPSDVSRGDDLSRFDALLGPEAAVLDTLTEEFDALLARMQTPEVRAATRRAFDASPDELRQAAMEAARRGDG